jgi:hypothetical protein
MRTPEAAVKAKVKEFLHSRKVQSLTHPIKWAAGYFWMPVGNQFGSPFLDFVICYRGNFIAVETKAPGGGLRARQTLVINMVREAGGFVIHGTDETIIPTLTDWFNHIDRTVNNQ